MAATVPTFRPGRGRRAAAIPLALLALGAFAPAWAPGAGADEDDRPPALPRRLYECALLTAPRRSFLREAAPGPRTGSEERFDAVLPRERDEPTRTVDSLYGLIEAAKTAAPAGSFESEGTRIGALGPSTLVVDASEDVHRAVAEGLATLAAPAADVGVVDVVVLGGDFPADAPDPSAAIARGGRVLAIGRASGFLGVTAASSSGAVEAYVGAYGTVAWREKAADKEKNVQPDPRVGVAKSGLAFQASVSRSGDRLALDLDGWYGGPVTLRATEVRSQSVVETPEAEVATFQRTERVVDGAWSFARQGAHTIAVRARVESRARRVVGGTALPAAPRGEPPSGPMTRRTLPIGDLVSPPASSTFHPTALRPSDYRWNEAEFVWGARAADEDATALLTGDALVDLVKSTDPRVWEADGARLDTGWSTASYLRVGSDPVRQAFVAEYVRALRARLARVVRIEATVVSVPAAAWTASAPERVDRERARTLARASLSTAPGASCAARDGVRRTFVRDYAPKVAEAAVLGNPEVADAWDGISLGARAWPTADGTAFGVEVEADVSGWKGAREVATPYGSVQCPALSMLRFRGQRVVAAGGEAALAASLDGDRVVVLLIGASWD